MKNGLPIYAAGSGYHGDVTVSQEKKDRDERLQLFVWGEEDVQRSDTKDPAIADTGVVVHMENFRIIQMPNKTGISPDTVRAKLTHTITTRTGMTNCWEVTVVLFSGLRKLSELYGSML